MLRRLIPVLSLFLTALTVLTVFAESASAQIFQGRRGGRGGLLGRRSNYYEPSPVVVDSSAPAMTPQAQQAQPAPANQPQTQVVRTYSRRPGLFGRRRGGFEEQVMVASPTQEPARAMPTVGYRAYYRTPTPDAPANTVLLSVQVPENAKIWIDGAETKSTGGSRQFVTPPLTPGREYMTEIKATWDENGQQLTRTRKIPVQAGQAVMVNLLQPTAEELRKPKQSRISDE